MKDFLTARGVNGRWVHALEAVATNLGSRGLRALNVRDKAHAILFEIRVEREPVSVADRGFVLREVQDRVGCGDILPVGE